MTTPATCELDHWIAGHEAAGTVVWPNGDKQTVCQPALNAIKRWCPSAQILDRTCVLCHTQQPDLNRHGECVECVDAAEGTSGF